MNFRWPVSKEWYEIFEWRWGNAAWRILPFDPKTTSVEEIDGWQDEFKNRTNDSLLSQEQIEALPRITLNQWEKLEEKRLYSSEWVEWVATFSSKWKFEKQLQAQKAELEEQLQKMQAQW